MKGSIVGPLAELPEEDDLLYRIKELVNEVVSDAFDQYQFDNPSEIYELIQNYFQKVPNAVNRISPVITPIIGSLLGKKCKILEVQSSATGYGMYNCREEIIDKTYLADETGAVKTRQLSTDAYLVMNLKESDPVAGSYPALALYDLLLSWQKIDDEGYLRWVGIPAMNDVRWVRTTEVTPATQNITCNIMHRDGGEAGAGELGYNIEVYADLASGINLDDVVPQLKNGEWYPAHCVQGKWWFLQHFDLSNADNAGEAMLRIAKIKSLDTDHYNCRLLAKDKSTELGSADIDVYPEEHLGSNNLSGTDVWPDRAVNDYLSVYYDIDGVWRNPGTVDDTTTC